MENQTETNGTDMEAIACAFPPNAAEAALEQLKPKLLAIPASQVRRHMVHTISAVVIGMRFKEAFLQDRDQLAGLFAPSAFSPDAYADLDLRIMALWHANVLVRRAIEGRNPIAQQIAEANILWNKLSRAAAYLFGADPDQKAIVSEIRSGKSRVKRADDLLALSALFDKHWPSVNGRCDLTREEIDQAKSKALAVISAMGSAEPGKELDQLRNLRDRAEEYLRQALEEIRAAAAYAYRNDPERLKRYPSIFAGRKKKRNASARNGEPRAAEPVALTGRQTVAA